MGPVAFELSQSSRFNNYVHANQEIFVIRSITSLMLLAAVCVPTLRAEDGPQPTAIELAGGGIKMMAPKEWKKGKPKSSMLQYEFSAPVDAKDDDPSARITIMAAGGGVEANIDRWYGQFVQPDGKSTKDASKLEEFDADGQTVHFVDIPGTFSESMGGGPFAPGKVVKREDYRMLGAIVVTKDKGMHFIKMTGPNKVVEELSEGFKKMLKELVAK